MQMGVVDRFGRVGLRPARAGAIQVHHPEPLTIFLARGRLGPGLVPDIEVEPPIVVEVTEERGLSRPCRLGEASRAGHVDEFPPCIVAQQALADVAVLANYDENIKVVIKDGEIYKNTLQ